MHIQRRLLTDVTRISRKLSYEDKIQAFYEEPNPLHTKIPRRSPIAPEGR
jgi:hypothetical protein